jgi:hypothetical protein
MRGWRMQCTRMVGSAEVWAKYRFIDGRTAFWHAYKRCYEIKFAPQMSHRNIVPGHSNSSISSNHAPSSQVERNYWYCIHNNQRENIGDQPPTKSPIELKDKFVEKCIVWNHQLISKLGRQENVVGLYLDQVFQWVRDFGFAYSAADGLWEM